MPPGPDIAPPADRLAAEEVGPAAVIDLRDRRAARVHGAAARPEVSAAGRLHRLAVDAGVSLREVDVLGARTHLLDRAALWALVDGAVAGRTRLSAVSVNLHWITLLRAQDEARRLSRELELGLIDGTPVKWVAGALTGESHEKHAGSDLVPELCRLSSERGWRIFFLGADPGVAERAAAVAHRRWPGCRIVGWASPPPEVVDDAGASARLCDAIDSTGADIVLVAFGMPRQERWIAAHRGALAAPVTLGIGGSLDFLAGEVRRAPGWAQRAGLEWAWRLMLEPRRLWRRYLVENRPAAMAALRLLARARRGSPPPVEVTALGSGAGLVAPTGVIDLAAGRPGPGDGAVAAAGPVMPGTGRSR